ncbi:MAG: PQQ-binding-like beta-propeller repeat protein [Planctomycetes bacterium]|nr:PQQ-binding-like beta-propeller repeat protein [Planctomycetota bacterium]
MKRFALSLCFALTLALTLTASDWPQWRGPDRTGISKETGLLKTWPKDGPPVVWTVKGCGNGFSSIAVADGVIYGTGAKGGKNIAWAKKESDGSDIWTTPYANEGGDPNSTVVVSGGKVYAMTVGGTLACLDTKGKVVWSKSFKKDLEGKMMSGWGYSETPLIDGDKLICTPGGDKGAVVALNKDDGKELWKCDIKDAGGAGYASPIKAVVGGVPMYITLLGKTGGVVAVHADTGKLLWQYAKINNGTANIPTIVTRDDLVWCSTGYGDGGSALLKMKADSKTEVSVTEVVKYKSGELQNHHGGMILVGDYVYFGNAHNAGHPACVEFKTGEIKYKEPKAVAGGGGSAAVVYADGRLYYRYQNGVVALIEANPKEMVLAGSFKEKEASGRECWAHPVIANGKLYLRDQDKLVCYNVKSPDKN